MNYRALGNVTNIRDLDFGSSTANHHGEYKFSKEARNSGHSNVAIRKHGARHYLLKDIKTRDPKLIDDVRGGTVSSYRINGLNSRIIFVYAPRGGSAREVDRYDSANRQYSGNKYIIDIVSGRFRTVSSKPKFCGTHTSPEGDDMLAFKSDGSLIIYNSSKGIFISDVQALEASNNMEEFEDKKAIKEASRKSENIDEDDVIEGVPKDDLRNAHNITSEQYIEKLQTGFGFTQEEARKFIENDFDKNYPDDDLRDRFLETMRRDEYKKILEHYHRIKESSGECPDELEDVDNINKKLDDLELVINESDEITESQIDVREIQEAINTVDKIDDTIEESETISENDSFL